jgi:hypothetical protein
VSQSDSFIEEVTQEVRRDRLFAAMKKYGWVAILAVLVIVGGAAWREWTASQERATAQATGDALLTALSVDSAEERLAALAQVDASKPAGQAAVGMLKAAELLRADKPAEAVAAFDAIATDGTLPEIYRQIAGLKALLAAGDTLDTDARKLRLEALVQGGGALRLVAEEQLALLEVSLAQPEAAIERLNRIVADAEASQGLRDRASRLIVAMGGSLVSVEADAGASKE